MSCTGKPHIQGLKPDYSKHSENDFYSDLPDSWSVAPPEYNLAFCAFQMLAFSSRTRGKTSTHQWGLPFKPRPNATTTALRLPLISAILTCYNT